MEVSGQLHASVKNPQYPLDRRLGGHQSLSGCCGVETNFCPYQELNLGHPAHHYSLQIWRVTANMYIEQTVEEIRQGVALQPVGWARV
jgi:hypothetical protein